MVHGGGKKLLLLKEKEGERDLRFVEEKQWSLGHFKDFQRMMGLFEWNIFLWIDLDF